MAFCKDCLHFEVCEAFGKTVKFPVDDGVCLHFAKDTNVLTNGDKIRATSDEELSRWIPDMCHGFVSKPWCDFRCQNCREGDDYRCEKCALEWLKQPVEG